MAAEVVVLPGVERRDLCGAPREAADVLRFAIENGIDDVIIVGRERNGKQYIASSLADGDKLVGVLMGAVWFLSSGELVQGYKETPTSPEGA